VLIPGYRSTGFRSQGRVRVFEEGWCAKAAKFAPQAIAATLAQLEAIADSGISLTHAVIVVGRWEDARVTEADRERLWARFLVPVFEQVAENGVLLAAECEAHCGLHIESGVVPEGAGEIDEKRCACGRTTARFIATGDLRARAAGR
jgi:hypothetical protein